MDNAVKTHVILESQGSNTGSYATQAPRLATTKASKNDAFNATKYSQQNAEGCDQILLHVFHVLIFLVLISVGEIKRSKEVDAK